MIKVILALSLLNSIMTEDKIEAKCDGEIINHCIKCNDGEDSDSCATCENKYFPFFNGLFCIPCNDSLYGQIGCEGNCDGTNYAETRFAFCQKGGCKEGFYNLNGICLNCSIGSPGCSKCSYEVQEEETEGNFKCYECISKEYRLTEFGECEHCSVKNCKKCHYINDTDAECDECIDGYYKSLNGECKECRNEYFTNKGYCLICSDITTAYDKSKCACYNGYAMDEESNCIHCDAGCSKCQYSNSTKSIECIECLSNYALNQNKKCIYCGDGCISCTLDKNDNPICSSCGSGTILVSNKCLPCSKGCKKCIIDEFSLYQNETKCIECRYGYNFNQEKECIDCGSINDTGGIGCEKCLYNEKKSKFECLSCSNDYYAYITNTFQCLSNQNQKQIYLFGCLKAIYNEQNNTFECSECLKDFVLIVNDKICKRKKDINISPKCLEYENLGTIINPLYSCRKCDNNETLFKIKSNGVKNCSSRYDNFSYCLEGEVEEDGTHKCTKCVELASVNNSNICNCNYDCFGKYNRFCYKCDDKKLGNIGCLASSGCEYFSSNDELDCNECKEGYFKYTKGQCFSCNDEIMNCEKCHFDERLKCDNCIGIFSPNANQDKCQINDCQEYPEISPGCIICKDKLEEYMSKSICQSCKNGYFKLKNGSCIYCKSEKYGGPACYECGYEKNENGIETDNIICKDCFSIGKFNQNYYKVCYTHSDYYYLNSALSSKGKCYSCKYDLSESCLDCEFLKDSEDNEKLKCTFCAPGYYLNEDGKCINYFNKIETIPNCEESIFKIGDINFYFKEYNNQPSVYLSLHYNDNYRINFPFYNKIIANKNPIKTICSYCFQECYTTFDGECENYYFKKCTVSYLLKNRNSESFIYCTDIGYLYNYPYVYIKLINNSIDWSQENIDIYNITGISSIYDVIINFNELTEETKNIVLNLAFVYKYSTEENAKFRFEACEQVIYIPKIKKYQCIKCKYGYFMDDKNYICYKISYDYYRKFYCEIENKGNYLIPVHSCLTCHSSRSILVTFENGVKLCIEDESLKNCLEVSVNSTYVNLLYNCESCNLNYISYYSKYYGKKICQNVFEKITKHKKISLEKFDGEDYIFADENGTCRKNYFTPDGKKCYKCDNKNVGSKGCKGDCSFSLDRNNTILCESECKYGYIEVSKGICDICDNVNKG